jgi:spore coat protein U-like protein
MKKFLLLTAIACTATVSAVAPAMSQTITAAGSIGVTSGVLASCTAPTAVAATVAGYDGTAVKTATSAITFKCTKSTVGTVKLKSASTNSSTGGTLSAGVPGETLTYTVSGDGVTRTGAGLSVAQPDLSVTSTISVAAEQDVVPGAYTDTVAVTVSY